MNGTYYGSNSKNGAWILRALEMVTPRVLGDTNQPNKTNFRGQLQIAERLVFIKSYQYATKSSQMEP